jgi:hypothetical protein
MKGYVCERLAAPSYEADTERENQSAELLRDDDVEQHRTRFCIGITPTSDSLQPPRTHSAGS